MFDLVTFSTRPCIVTDDGNVLSYAEIDDRARQYADTLDQGHGLVLLGCRNDVDTIVAYLGACKAGYPVLFADGERDATIETLSANFRPRYIQRPGEALVCTTLPTGAAVHPDLAVLLSTSGSTGAAKAVRLSRDNIQSNAASIAEYLCLDAEDRAALTLPLHYSYGLSVLNSHLMRGGSLWLTGRSVTDTGFWSDFEALRCTSFPGVPHTYQILARSGFGSAPIPSLRYATQAGGHLSSDLVRHFGEMSERDGWKFYVMYGQTEAAPRMSYVPPELLVTNPDSIGIAIPGGRFRIESDPEDPHGAGELIYAGPNVMMGYAQAEADLAKGREVDELRTGDVAVQAPNGLFKIVGRRSRFIKPFGLRISLDEVERWLAGRGVAAAAVGDDTALGVFFVGGNDHTADVTALSAWLKIPTASIATQTCENLPLQASGKVDYATLTRRFATTRAETAPALANDMTKLFRSFFPGQAVTDQDSFNSLGGDSLKFVQFSLAMESMVGKLPNDWEQRTLGDLRAMTESRVSGEAPPPRRVRFIDTTTVLRAYAITCVLIHHLDLWKWSPNGSTLLLAIAGMSFGRFQLPEVLRSDRVVGIWRSIMHAAIPMVGYVALNQLLHRDLFVPGLLMFANYLPPHSGFDEWFLEVYIQIFIVAALALSIPWLREQLRVHPVAVSGTVFAATVALAVMMPSVWDTSLLFDRVPHMMVWLFAAGVLFSQSRDQITRPLALGAFCLTTIALSQSAILTANLCIGMALATFIPTMPIPSLLVRPISEIAAGSLFIYLTHFQIAAVVSLTTGGAIPVVSVLSALVGGVGIAKAYAYGERRLREHAPRLTVVRQITRGRSGRHAPEI